MSNLILPLTAAFCIAAAVTFTLAALNAFH
jgi:hypothetical protein